MATNNEIRATIKLRYDTLTRWLSENPKPAAGEVCVVVIPTSSTTQPDYTVGSSPTESGLTPYAIGLKVGDGSRYFQQLPWIQAVAGDIYEWAKKATPPDASKLDAIYDGKNTKIQTILDILSNTLANLSGEEVAVEYGNENTNVQDAIERIEESIGGIVAANIPPDAITNALNQLQEQLDDQSGDIFIANQNNVTYKIDTLTRQGLTISATSSPLVVSDISDLVFNKGYNKVNNKAATMGDLSDLRTDILNNIPSAMRFRGISTTEITDGGTENPTINNTENTGISEGDIVLYNNKEFIWTGNNWEMLGDDLAQPNVIESISINNTPVNVVNKNVNLALADIAFDGEVKNLKQTDDTILIFDCGTAETVI